MKDDALFSLVRDTELFGELDEEAVRRLIDRSRRRTYRRGDLIFHQGDQGDSLFVLVEGVVKVVVTSEQGEEMVLVTLYPPATFGELAMVDGRPRSASVEALEPTTVLMIDRSMVLELTREYPPLTDGLLRSLGGLLRRLTDEASDFVFLDLHGRVAKRLLTLAAAHAEERDDGLMLDLHMTQGDLARMVGGSRQRVNQILGSFADRGYLELHGRTVLVKQFELLRRRTGL